MGGAEYVSNEETGTLLLLDVILVVVEDMCGGEADRPPT